MSLRSTAFAAKSFTVKRTVRRVHRELLAHERMPLSELTAMQDQLAREIVNTAMQSSPFYRRTYGELGVDPKAVTNPGAWAELPILDRATVKAHSADIRTPPGHAAHDAPCDDRRQHRRATAHVARCAGPHSAAGLAHVLLVGRTAL